SSAALRASLTVLALSALAVGLLAVAIPARRRVILAALLLVGLVDWGRARAASVMTLTHAPASNAQVDGLVLAGGGRVWRDNASLRAVERSGVRGPQGFADELDFLERTFASARPTLRGIDELGGYSPVALRDWQEVIRRFSGAPDVLFRMFNVCWIVSSSERVWTSRHGLEVAATLAPNVVLLRYHGCLPRAWVAPELEALPSRDAVLERMSRPDFEPAQTAVLEATAASRLRWQSGEARVTRPGAGELVVDVSGDGDRLVVIAETWAEGWQAEVDGAPADVLRVNGTLLGAHLGPGQHQLRLEYGEPALRWAVPVSAIALLLLGLARWRGRHRPSGDTP
ncbi:MAG: hypothetical protein AB1938_01265, partial [Myxococcota bacterium]